MTNVRLVLEMIARNIVRCIGGRLGPNLFAAGTHTLYVYRERKHSHLAAENNGKAQHESRVFLAARSLSTGNLTSSRHCQFAFDKKI